MTIVFNTGAVLEILRSGGKFTLAQASGTIAAASALAAVPTPPTTLTPHVEITLEPPTGLVFMTERFNWGRTTGSGQGGASNVDGVYYELWNQGKPRDPMTKQELPDFFGQEVGYYCSGIIRASCVDNLCTHILASESILLKLWNISSPAVEVTYDFTVWYALLKALDIPKLKDYFDIAKAIRDKK